jgi:hypothetical protein
VAASGAGAAGRQAAYDRLLGRGRWVGFGLEGLDCSLCAAAGRARLDRTVAIEYRWGEGRAERYVDIAAEFVRLKVDVIVTSGSAVVAAAIPLKVGFAIPTCVLVRPLLGTRVEVVYSSRSGARSPLPACPS